MKKKVIKILDDTLSAHGFINNHVIDDKAASEIIKFINKI